MSDSSRVHTPAPDSRGQFYMPHRHPLYLAIQKWRWRRMKERVRVKQKAVPHRKACTRQKTIECSYGELYLLIIALGMVLALEVGLILSAV